MSVSPPRCRLAELAERFGADKGYSGVVTVTALGAVNGTVAVQVTLTV